VNPSSISVRLLLRPQGALPKRKILALHPQPTGEEDGNQGGPHSGILFLYPLQNRGNTLVADLFQFFEMDTQSARLTTCASSMKILDPPDEADAKKNCHHH